MSPGLMLEYKSMLIDYRARRQHNVSLFRIKIYGRRLSIFPLVCVRGRRALFGRELSSTVAPIRPLLAESSRSSKTREAKKRRPADNATKCCAK